jgi:transmembrane 9 superfamily protein 3
MGGLLPFGSIFIEMYFVFTSFWNYKVKGQFHFFINSSVPLFLFI